MRATVRIALMILGVSALVAAQDRGDRPGARQHKPGHTHFVGKNMLTGKGSPSGNSGSTSNGSGGDSGSMNFKPVLGGTPPSTGNGGSGGNGPTGGNPSGGNPPGGNPPGGNPPGGNPPGGNPPGGPGGPDTPPTWGGPIGGGPGDPPTHTVPEIDPASGMSAITLLSGALVVMRVRRKKNS